MKKIINGNEYELRSASPFEVGLYCNGKGVRTWFFDRLNNINFENYDILQAIEIHERQISEVQNEKIFK